MSNMMMFTERGSVGRYKKKTSPASPNYAILSLHVKIQGEHLVFNVFLIGLPATLP